MRVETFRVFICFCLFVSLFPSPAVGAQGSSRPIGVAKVDVTPSEPIRLTGYAVRKTNSIDVEQKLWAKALAIAADADGPALLITLVKFAIAEGTYKDRAPPLANQGDTQQRS